MALSCDAIARQRNHLDYRNYINNYQACHGYPCPWGGMKIRVTTFVKVPFLRYKSIAHLHFAHPQEVLLNWAFLSFCCRGILTKEGADPDNKVLDTIASYIPVMGIINQ